MLGLGCEGSWCPVGCCPSSALRALSCDLPVSEAVPGTGRNIPGLIQVGSPLITPRDLEAEAFHVTCEAQCVVTDSRVGPHVLVRPCELDEATRVC